jgi:hypothetical protein
MRHSEINNPDEMHFSRIRRFSEEPSQVFPDFRDQILVSETTGIAYYANSADQGDILPINQSQTQQPILPGVVYFFEDSVSVEDLTPAIVGQVFLQLPDGIVWKANGTEAGQLDRLSTRLTYGVPTIVNSNTGASAPCPPGIIKGDLLWNPGLRSLWIASEVSSDLYWREVNYTPFWWQGVS